MLPIREKTGLFPPATRSPSKRTVPQSGRMIWYSVGTSFLISSHILDELSKIADTIGMIDHGAMLGEISMDDICKKGIGLEDYYLDLLGGGGKGEEPYFSGN